MRLTTDVEVATSVTFQDSNLINGDDEARLDPENKDGGNIKQGEILYSSFEKQPDVFQALTKHFSY